MRCKMCGRNVKSRMSRLKVYGFDLGKFKSQVCGCGSVVFDEPTDEMVRALITRGLVGLGSIVKVGKLGDSLMIRISRKLANFLELSKGAEVRVYPIDRNKFVVEIGSDEEGYQKDISTEQYQKDILLPQPSPKVHF